MQIAIEIDEELYEEVKGYHELTECELAIFNGTVLPKHGPLIDADDIWDAYHDLDYDFYEAFDRAPTILEATGVSE